MESFMEIFNKVRDIVKTQISLTAFDVWIKPIEPMKLEEDTAYLFIKSAFQKKILTEKYTKYFTEAFEQVLGFAVTVEIFSEEDVNSSEMASPKELVTEMNTNSFKKQLLDKTYLNSEYEYTFDTFIVGPSNSFAYSASRAVAKGSNSEYNPLFIYGQSGLGKTHLLMAIRHEKLSNDPDLNIIYVTGEQFTNEFILAIENKMLTAFKNKFREADILLVDDIQFIGGKEQTQEEFFYTFNVLHQVGKQIIITSDRPPKDIKSLHDRLLNRFEWGLLTDITIPDFETRIAIIQRKAQLLDIQIPNEVVEYVANRLKTNIRQIEGAVKKIKAYKLMTGSLPSISMAQIVIKDILNDSQPVPITVEKILNEVSRTYGISVSEIRSRNRSAQISLARQTAIYIVKEITGMTLDMIGEEFSGRDHATIVYGLQKVEKNLKENSHYKEIINDIINNIKNSMS